MHYHFVSNIFCSYPELWLFRVSERTWGYARLSVSWAWRSALQQRSDKWEVEWFFCCWLSFLQIQDRWTGQAIAQRLSTEWRMSGFKFPGVKDRFLYQGRGERNLMLACCILFLIWGSGWSELTNSFYCCASFWRWSKSADTLSITLKILQNNYE